MDEHDYHDVYKLLDEIGPIPLPLMPFSPPTYRCVQCVATASDLEPMQVRLTLTLSAASLAAHPGRMPDDCGKCACCLDKPRFGGPGTKRQKCMTKQRVKESGIRIWAAVSPLTQQQRMYEQRPLPQQLVDALQVAPLPVVWGLRRKTRARQLPRAFVLMYHCDSRVLLDRAYLAPSLERHKGSGSRTPLLPMRAIGGNNTFNATSRKRIKHQTTVVRTFGRDSEPLTAPLEDVLGSDTELNTDEEFDERTEEAFHVFNCGGCLCVEPTLLVEQSKIDDDLAFDDDIFVNWATTPMKTIHHTRRGKERHR